MEFLTQNIPAGIKPGEAEIFYNGTTLQVITAGLTYTWPNFPENVKAQLLDEMLENTKAIELMKDIGLNAIKDQMYLYAKCKYGGFNNSADLAIGKKGKAENWPCNCQKKGCCLSSLFRQGYNASNGTLTAREVAATKLIAQGRYGKEIAFELCISMPTLDKMKQQIFSKTNTSSISQLSAWASRENLV